MGLADLKLIKDEKICLSYYPSTADLRIIDEITYDVLSLLKEGGNIQGVLKSHGEKEKLLTFIQSLSTLEENTNVESVESINEPTPKSRIKSLHH